MSVILMYNELDCGVPLGTLTYIFSRSFLGYDLVLVSLHILFVQLPTVTHLLYQDLWLRPRILLG